MSLAPRLALAASGSFALAGLVAQGEGGGNGLSACGARSPALLLASSLLLPRTATCQSASVSRLAEKADAWIPAGIVSAWRRWRRELERWREANALSISRGEGGQADPDQTNPGSLISTHPQSIHMSSFQCASVMAQLEDRPWPLAGLTPAFILAKQ
jgi:hypothetical protein